MYCILEGMSAPSKKGPGLYEFLVEAELQQYFSSFKYAISFFNTTPLYIFCFVFRNNLKVTHPSQLKFTTEGDLVELGMSKPEMRRLRKYYEKHFPNNYLSKIRKFITTRKQDSNAHDSGLLIPTENVPISRMSRVSSKHIIPAASITVNKELGMGEFGVVQQGVWCNEGERIQVFIFISRKTEENS